MIDSEKIQFTTEICMYIYFMGFFFNLIESIRFMELKRILKVKEHLSEMLTLIENTGGCKQIAML